MPSRLSRHDNQNDYNNVGDGVDDDNSIQRFLVTKGDVRVVRSNGPPGFNC